MAKITITIIVMVHKKNATKISIKLSNFTFFLNSCETKADNMEEAITELMIPFNIVYASSAT